MSYEPKKGNPKIMTTLIPRKRLSFGSADLDQMVGGGLLSGTAALISGAPGVGKTTLAAHLAHRLRPHFPDGVLWATAVNDDPMHIAESWAAALGYNFAGLGTLADRSAALRAMLAEKRALLVVDDVTVAASIKLLLPETGLAVNPTFSDILGRTFRVGVRLDLQ